MPARAPTQQEFIALLAMLVATVAFSIDAMLPAMPRISAELSPAAPNRAQLIITLFVLGMGFGTFFAGPLSDAFGRKPVIVAGAALYISAALVAYFANTLEAMLAARMVQGIGASGPRVVALAVIRDRYAGRQMARIVSFVMIVFTLVPAFAPTLGAGIIAVFGWRGIFLAFTVFSALSTAWLLFRLPETLPPERRRPVRWTPLRDALAELATHPTVRLSIAVQSLAFAMLFSVLSSTQTIFDEVFGRGNTFHYWFGGIALSAGSAGFLNARLVVRTGMRPLIKAILGVEIVIAGGMVAVWLAGTSEAVAFAAYVFWTTSVFFQTGLCIGNLNALAMEPMGHIAGVAASAISAISTVGAVAIAIPIGLAYDGTPLPIAIGILICAIAARLLTGFIRRESDPGV